MIRCMKGRVPSGSLPRIGFELLRILDLARANHFLRKTNTCKTIKRNDFLGFDLAVSVLDQLMHVAILECLKSVH